MSKDQTNIDYAALVAAEKAKASPKPSLVQVLDDNYHHFAGFAEAGANLNFACDWVAAEADCNKNSLRRIFLLKFGQWSQFRPTILTTGRQTDLSPAVSKIPSDDTGDTGFTRFW